MSMPWMSQAAAYGATAATVNARVRASRMRRRPSRRLDEHDRMVGVESSRRCSYTATTSGGGNVRVRRLVGPLPGAEPGMGLERVDDPVEQRLRATGRRRRRRAPARAGARARRRVELLRRRRQLLRDAGRCPDGVVPDEADAGSGDLRPASRPDGASLPRGGGSESPIGNTRRPATTRFPVAASTVTLVIAVESTGLGLGGDPPDGPIAGKQRPLRRRNRCLRQSGAHARPEAPLRCLRGRPRLPLRLHARVVAALARR